MMIIKKIVVGLILFCGQLSMCSEHSSQDIKDRGYQLSACHEYYQKNINGPDYEALVSVDRDIKDFDHCVQAALRMFEENAKLEGLDLSRLGGISIEVKLDRSVVRYCRLLDDHSPFARSCHELGKIERLGQAKKASSSFSSSSCQTSDLGVAESEPKQ
jgi:hypothetical protein